MLRRPAPKKGTHWLVLTPLFFFSALFSAGSFAGTWHHFENRQKGFSVSVPPTWEIREDVLGAAAVFASPRQGIQDDFRENVNVVLGDIPSGMTTERYFDFNLNLMKKIYSDFHLVRTGLTRINGDEARWLIFTQRMKKLRVKVLLYLDFHGARIYAITCSSLPSTYAHYERIFQKIAKSFRALPDAGGASQVSARPLSTLNPAAETK